MNLELVEELAQFAKDPYGFVVFAFPWGEPGELQNAKIEPWQEKILRELGEGLVNFEGAIRLARTSGHGIGKSALVSWLILWAMSTHEDTVGVVTANTENQLKTKTWVQLAKWYRLFIGRELFKMTATALFSVDPEHERTWRFDMVPWSERNTEAFAGLHNQGKRILVVFDEASAIPDTIWEVTEGALTDENTEIIWAVFGNPTRNSGRFRDCFPGGRFEHRWRSDRIDSRTVSFTNKTQIEEWINDYGIDSDFVRIRVLGVFPRVDADSFISYESALEAARREIEPQTGHPIILGVDVGRFGDDPSVIYPRQGRDCRTHPPRVYPGIDTMALVKKIVDTFHELRAAVIYVDEGGVGGGVVDRLRQLQMPVFGVDFGSKPDGSNPERGVKYRNKRAEIWGAVKDALPRLAIVERVPGLDQTLPEELSSPTYGLNDKEEIQLESKKEMRRRGKPSPNVADALACTFAFPIMEPDLGNMSYGESITIAPDYNPYSREMMDVQ